MTHFAASRPPLSEAAAVRRALAMTELPAAPAYFVHLSSREAIDEVRRARARGRVVLAETRPIYLYLTEERFLEPNGAKYVGYPPLRSAEHRDALWAALADGTIDVVATDHCSWTLERKISADRFTRMPPGMSNLETLVPMLYSEGVAKGRISISRWVDLTATNAAKIFGMYPRKGAIVEGADADLVIFDPNRKVMIDSHEMHSRADYDPFEGFEVTGWPKMTISRGVPIVTDRKVDTSHGRGEFIARDRFSPAGEANSLADRVRPRIEFMDTKTVALAGGSGFIGRAIARRLIAVGGLKVRVLTRNPDKARAHLRSARRRIRSLRISRNPHR